MNTPTQTVKNILRFVRDCVYTPIYAMSCLVPRNKHVWVLGNRSGKSYIDNTKHLFEYIVQHEPDIKAVWLTKEPRVYKALKKRGLPVAYTYSFQGWYYSLIAGAAIVCVEKHDVNVLAIGGAKKIQLWHATPLKKFAFNRTTPKTIWEHILAGVSKYREETYDALTTTYNEPNAVDDFAVGLGIPKEHIYVTGYPRNDMLFSSENVYPTFLAEKKKEVSFEKVVLYMPTFRDGLFDQEQDLFFRYGWNQENIEQILEKHNAVLIIRLHFHTKPEKRFLEDLKKAKRIIFTQANDPLEDSYALLKHTDVLLTDYSSVFFDYSLLNRPMIFAPFDIEEYVKNHCKLGYVYDEVTPGMKAYSWSEIEQGLDRALSGGELPQEAQRRIEISRRFNTYQDGNSARRVAEMIKRFIQK